MFFCFCFFFIVGVFYLLFQNVTLFGSGILLIRNPLKSLVSHRKWVLGVTTNLSAHTAEMEIGMFCIRGLVP